VTNKACCYNYSYTVYTVCIQETLIMSESAVQQYSSYANSTSSSPYIYDSSVDHSYVPRDTKPTYDSSVAALLHTRLHTALLRSVKHDWWRVVSNQRSCSTAGPVSTWMGDCLRAGKPSQYATSQLGRLSLLPSVRW